MSPRPMMNHFGTKRQGERPEPSRTQHELSPKQMFRIKDDLVKSSVCSTDWDPQNPELNLSILNIVLPSNSDNTMKISVLKQRQSPLTIWSERPFLSRIAGLLNFRSRWNSDLANANRGFYMCGDSSPEGRPKGEMKLPKYLIFSSRRPTVLQKRSLVLK